MGNRVYASFEVHFLVSETSGRRWFVLFRLALMRSVEMKGKLVECFSSFFCWAARG